MDKQTFIQRARDLQGHYQPSLAVRLQLAGVDMVATVGPTAAGKTTIMERSGVPYILSDVTRAPRKHERNGIDYNFRTDYDRLLQEIEAGEFVQFLVEQNGEFYGTKIASFPTSGPCTMAVVAAAMPRFRTLGFRKVLGVYIVPPSYEEWMRRVSIQHDKDLAARLREAKESLQIALSDSDFCFLINDDLDEATEAFRRLATGEEPANDGLQAAARQVALALFSRIEL
jgi:guanylate kinase